MGAEMAANQGNWLAIKTILNLMDNPPQPAQLSKMFLHMVGSSVFLCRAGRQKNCQRCANDLPHDPDVSFEKCVECLIAYGLTPNHATNQSLNSSLMMMMDMDNRFITSHPLYRLLNTNYKRKERFASYTKIDPNLPTISPLKCCDVCGATEWGSKLCSRCKKVYYCTRYCQVRDWPTHKTHCKAN